MIDMRHGLVKLGKAVDWDRLDEVFGATYCPDNGRPGVSTRLMVALHYLKYTYNLSDEDVVDGWVENPYWQHLSGMKYFEHKVPIEPSSMTRWRKRIGESGAETLLKETIEAGLKLKAVKATQLRRINVDTTVQEKDEPAQSQSTSKFAGMAMAGGMFKMGDKVYLNAGVSLFLVPDAELFTTSTWAGNLGIVIPLGNP